MQTIKADDVNQIANRLQNIIYQPYVFFLMTNLIWDS
jgi:hypothetical protein